MSGGLVALGAVAAVVLALLALAPTGAEAAKFGFNDDFPGFSHGMSATDKVRLAKAPRANVIRFSADWRGVEPQRDVWNEAGWARWAEVYRAARARGIRPIFILGYAPPWARDHSGPRECWPEFDNDGRGACELPPSRAMDGEWAEFVREAARRFPRAVIEIWNEPNLKAFWDSGPDPARFAELQIIGYKAVKRVHSKQPVLLGGLAGITKGPDSVRRFLGRAYRARPKLRGKMDAYSLHSYLHRAKLTRVWRVLRQARRAGRRERGRVPFWITETGIAAGERRQARVSARLHRALTRRRRVRAVLFHRLLEPVDTGTSAFDSGTAWTKFGPYPPRPKRVFCRFVAMRNGTYNRC